MSDHVHPPLPNGEDQIWFEHGEHDDDKHLQYLYVGDDDRWVRLVVTPPKARRIAAALTKWADAQEAADTPPRSTGAFWTARATLTTIGQGRVELSMDEAKVRVAIPVTLPSEEQVLGTLLYQPVVLSIAPAPSEGKTAEEDLAWHRAEVLRLRALLADVERGGTTGVRVEQGYNRMCITAPTDGGEQALFAGFTSWLADRGVSHPEVAEQLKKAEQRAYHAGALAALSASALYLPQEGKRLGPGPCEAIKKLVADEDLNAFCAEAMRRYLDEQKAKLAEATFEVDAKEWGRNSVNHPAEDKSVKKGMGR